jgi:hypothetical protein
LRLAVILTVVPRHNYIGNFMHSRTLRGVSALALLLACAAPAAAADDVTLLRVFLTDGSVLISYGEPARVDDRVIFSMPTSVEPDPPLHLINLAADRVDWPRTDRYAEAARAAHYINTQAEGDYAALSGRMAQALNQLTEVDDAGRRLAIAENARRMLAAWPLQHYNYRLDEVRQMLGLLDEAIADLRAAAGDGRFDFSLSAFAEPPPAELLASPPTARETIEQVLTAARVADSAPERTALLEIALAALDRDISNLPAEWAATFRASTRAQVEAERRIDRSYRSLTTRIVAVADRHARAADVRGLARLVDQVRVSDQALGSQRPDSVAALIAAVEARLDAARRLQLARDRWALRAPELRQYRTAIKTPLDLLAAMEPPLEQIKLLAGSSPASLLLIQQSVARILEYARTIVPPDELRSAHALLVSAVQLAGSAGQIRREAAVAGDITRAWDASAAAAGALMLAARARTDMQSLFLPPQLR